MTTTQSEVAAQLAEEFHRRVSWPAGLLLGPDLTEEIDARAAERVRLLAAQIIQDDDDRLSAPTVIDVMCVLWPTGDPEECGEADWWRTPLGRMCARSLARQDAEAVTYSAAAAMLGVAKGTVSVMVQRGTLDRHPDGGVLRSSVLQRLGR